MVDVGEGVLGLEWIEGKSVRKLLPGGAEEVGEEEDEEEDEEDPLASYGISQGTTTSSINHSVTC
jgi:TP53 regulating kinase and related kinases